MNENLTQGHGEIEVTERKSVARRRSDFFDANGHPTGNGLGRGPKER
jgi:hypothetical protein